MTIYQCMNCDHRSATVSEIDLAEWAGNQDPADTVGIPVGTCDECGAPVYEPGTFDKARAGGAMLAALQTALPYVLTVADQDAQNDAGDAAVAHANAISAAIAQAEAAGVKPAEPERSEDPVGILVDHATSFVDHWIEDDEPEERRAAAEAREEIAKAETSLRDALARLDEARKSVRGGLEYDEAMDDAERAPTGDDYNELFAWLNGAAAALNVKVEPKPAKPAATKRRVPVCSNAGCGSENVRADAYAEWDGEAGRWEVAEAFEKGGYCNDCGGECRIVWRDRT